MICLFQEVNNKDKCMSIQNDMQIENSHLIMSSFAKQVTDEDHEMENIRRHEDNVTINK